MAKIIKVTPQVNPNFVKPITITYEQKGAVKIWEAVISHDAVSILLYNQDRDSFVLVKQFRPPVLNANKTNGSQAPIPGEQPGMEASGGIPEQGAGTDNTGNGEGTEPAATPPMPGEMEFAG